MGDKPEVTVRDHCVSPQHGLDRVKLSIQHGPLGSFDRADGELLARLWNDHHRTSQSESDAVRGLVEALREIASPNGYPSLRLREIARTALTRYRGEVS